MEKTKKNNKKKYPPPPPPPKKKPVNASRVDPSLSLIHI